MKLTIVGSGGAIPTPRPFCQCSTCEKARKEGEPYKRNSSSLFIDDIFTLIDCGEDIGDSLNRRNIKRVDNLFITHWHPDHTYGLRPLMEAHFNFFEGKPEKSLKICLPKKVLEDLKQHFPSISYFTGRLKVATPGEIEHGNSVRFGNIKVTAVGFQGKDSSIFAYLLEEKNKRVLYAPCDTIHFEEKIFNLDLLITECGLFSSRVHEISFPAMMERIKLLKPKKTILTHIEEDEIKELGWNYLNKMKEQYADVDFDFAYDGMEIEV